MSVFEDFSDEYDSPKKYGDIDSSVISKYRGRVPDELLEFWEEEGLAGYAVGVFWTINPELYKDVVARCLNTEYNVVPIFRTAFGDIIVQYTNRLDNLSFAVIDLKNQVVTSIPYDDIEEFFNDYLVAFGGLLHNIKIKSELFWKVYRGLGALESDKCYAFEPLLALGGKMSEENVRIVNFDAHLELLVNSLDKPIDLI